MDVPRQHAPILIPELHYRSTIIAFADVVDFDRLLQRGELESGRRVLAFLVEAQQTLVPSRRGKCLQRVGDGLVLEFLDAHDAAACALALHARAAEYSSALPEEDRMRLRIGIYSGDVLSDNTAYFGRGINLAERLSKLCQPGQTVVSAGVRDQLTDGLDGELEDLGECFVKHGTSVRSFRLWPRDTHVVDAFPGKIAELLRPTVAVVPFLSQTSESEHAVVGEILADEIIAILSRARELRIVSRLSTSALRNRGFSPADIGSRVGAHYALTGTYRISAGTLRGNVELARTQTGEVVWAAPGRDRVSSILAGDSGLVSMVAAEASAAIVATEIARTTTHALPTLDAYTLLFGGIGLIHRARYIEFSKAREVFEHLIDRFPRHSTPRAWLAAWHVFKVTQGWFSELEKEVLIARTSVHRALDCNPSDPLALTMHGLVHTNLVRDLGVAQSSYDEAVRCNPNEPLALLHRGTLAAFQGRGAEATSDTEVALKLSPLDPWKYYYDALAATAALSAEDYERALELAKRSHRVNRTHASTLRAIAIACVELGRDEEAHEAIEQLLVLDKNITVGSWLKRSPSACYETGKRWADSLRRAGLPA